MVNFLYHAIRQTGVRRFMGLQILRTFFTYLLKDQKTDWGRVSAVKKVNEGSSSYLKIQSSRICT